MLDPEIKEEARSVLGTDAHETMAGQHMVRCIKEMIGVMYEKTTRNRHLNKNEQAFLNFVATVASFKSVKEIAGLSQYMLGQQLGFSAGAAHRRFKKGDERAKKIRELRYLHKLARSRHFFLCMHAPVGPHT